MKKPFILLTSTLLISAIISGCNTIKDTTPIAASTNTNQTQHNYKDEYDALKYEYDSLVNIYDESVSEAIKTYCEKYLTYTGNVTDNISEVESIVTENYYNELKAQTGHKAYDKKYEQATGVEELYYANPLSPYDTAKVAALCKQTIIFNNDVKTSTVVYIFNMQFQDNNWKINSVETRS